MTAHKNDLLETVASKIKDLPKADLKLAIELLFNYLAAQLIEQNRIEIRGFGSFSLRDRMNHKMHIEKNLKKPETYKAVYFRGTKNKKNSAEK